MLLFPKFWLFFSFFVGKWWWKQTGVRDTLSLISTNTCKTRIHWNTSDMWPKIQFEPDFWCHQHLYLQEYFTTTAKIWSVANNFAYCMHWHVGNSRSWLRNFCIKILVGHLLSKGQCIFSFYQDADTLWMRNLSIISKCLDTIIWMTCMTFQLQRVKKWNVLWFYSNKYVKKVLFLFNNFWIFQQI